MFLGMVMAVGGRRSYVISGTRIGFVKEMTPLLTMGDHAVDGAPVGESTDVTVVDEEVGLQLAGEVGIVVSGLLGVVAVGSVEFYTALTTPVNGGLQELALTTGPEDEAMAVLDEHLEGLGGEGALLTDLRVAVLDDRPVKIYCYNHI